MTIDRIPLITVTTNPIATDSSLKLNELNDEFVLAARASSVIFFCATLSPRMIPKLTPSSKKLKKKVMSLARKICRLRIPWFSHFTSLGFGASFSE